MRFYEYHTHPEIDMESMLLIAEKLGWSGICLISTNLKEIESLRKRVKSPLDVCFGYKIKADNPGEIPRLARKARKKTEIILVFGGDPEINRKACETPEVDILTHPEMGRKDPGIDTTMAKLAKRNGVSIEFNFRSLLLSYGKARADIFSNMLGSAKIVKKTKAPFVLTSGALDPHDMRSPSEMISFGRVLGLDLKEIKFSLSPKMLENNRKRMGKKWIMPGVEIE